MATTERPELTGGRYPMVTFRVRREFPRPPVDLVSQLERFTVPDVSDLVGRMYTMDGSVHSLYLPATKLLGTALTVKLPPGDNMGVKAALMYCKPGDVLVIDAQGFTEWCCGGFTLLKRSIKERGLRGLAVNGAYRDALEAQEAKFPIYAKGVAPYSGPKRGPAEVNVPVCCGGVIVEPGDVVFGDEEGVVVVPQAYVERVVARLVENEGKKKATKLTPADAAAAEAISDRYFHETFEEKGGIYLD